MNYLEKLICSYAALVAAFAVYHLGQTVVQAVQHAAQGWAAQINAAMQ